jgi:hypothetical protein
VYVADRIRVGNDERLQESRMREIRTSGLTRGSSGIGESRPLLSTPSPLARENPGDSRKAAEPQRKMGLTFLSCILNSQISGMNLDDFD